MTDSSRPENKDAESIGNGLFQEDLGEWTKLYEINTFSAFFVTSAFLGLLAKGAQDRPEGTTTVVNITSMSAAIKVAQDHVRLYHLSLWQGCI
jgi:NAD(P)-dependent dehydrogenase (short-subunit alcohol dehydrogenase family)